VFFNISGPFKKPSSSGQKAGAEREPLPDAADAAAASDRSAGLVDEGR
jgi:hypothetical protein